MSKGKNSILQMKMEKIASIMDRVSEDPSRYKNLEILENKLKEVDEEIEIMLLRWRAKADNAIGFFALWKTSKQIKILEQYQNDIQKYITQCKEFKKN